MNEIRCTNIIYISNISKLGGVESYAYYMAKKYRDYDIMVLCKSGNINQLERILEVCPAEIHNGQKIYCKTMIINYDTSILDYVEERRRLYDDSCRLYAGLLQSISKLKKKKN